MRNKKLHLQVERVQVEYLLKVRIPVALEELFKKMSEGAEPHKSTVWVLPNGEGAKFYNRSMQYQRMEERLAGNTLNDYGASLIEGSRVNIAPLRTIGASKGVTLTCKKWNTNNPNNLDLDYYVKELAQYAQAIWKEYIQKAKIKATITFDV